MPTDMRVMPARGMTVKRSFGNSFRLIFLVLLANDKQVLGPWTNSSAQNWIAGLVAWTVTTFSLAPLITTFYPSITLR